MKQNSFGRCRLLILILSWLLLVTNDKAIAGIDPVKLMSYNLLNYPNKDANQSITADTIVRNPYYRISIAAANPDILVVQELISLAGLTGFLNNVMNIALSGFAAGTFIDGPDSDNGIFYRTSKFSFISNTRIKTDLRDINEFKLKNLLSGDTIRIFSVHLKATNTTPDEAQRALEVDSLRNYTNALPSGSNFVVCGDFNISTFCTFIYIKIAANNKIRTRW